MRVWCRPVCKLDLKRTILPIRLSSTSLLNSTSSGEKQEVGEKDVPQKTLFVDLKSLEKYRSIHGHLLIPARFGFREEEREGLGIYASSLGRHAVNLRQAYLKLEDSEKENFPWVQQLQKIGFVWAPREEAFRLQVRAMLHYQKLFGDFLIPCKFVVPVGHEDWPKEFLGLKLGRNCEYIRFGSLPDHRRAYLKEMGVPQEDLVTQKAERILQAIEVYKKVYKQTAETLDIKKSFVVPLCDDKWPENLWGMNLGEAVYSIRNMHCYDKYLAKFEEAGVKIMPKEYAELFRAQLKMRNQAKKEQRAALKQD